MNPDHNPTAHTRRDTPEERDHQAAEHQVVVVLDRDPLPAPPVEAVAEGQATPAFAAPLDHPLVVPGEQPKLKRHGFSARFVHWSVALSTIVLLFSGFGQMPMYARYKVDQLPLMGWASDYDIVIVLHYVAAAVLVLAVTLHIALHFMRGSDILPRRGDVKESYHIIKAMLGRGEEPPSDKYLAEQRLAYAFIGASILLLVVSGYVKVIKNLPGVDIPYWLLWSSTTLHNLATFLIIFGVIGHLAAFAFKENRKLLGGIFHGKVDLEYARHRHCHWCDRLGITHPKD
jgi:formate dehydrogenase gamma subunit